MLRSRSRRDRWIRAGNTKPLLIDIHVRKRVRGGPYEAGEEDVRECRESGRNSCLSAGKEGAILSADIVLRFIT